MMGQGSKHKQIKKDTMARANIKPRGGIGSSSAMKSSEHGEQQLTSIGGSPAMKAASDPSATSQSTGIGGSSAMKRSEHGEQQLTSIGGSPAMKAESNPTATDQVVKNQDMTNNKAERSSLQTENAAAPLPGLASNEEIKARLAKRKTEALARIEEKRADARKKAEATPEGQKQEAEEARATQQNFNKHYTQQELEQITKEQMYEQYDHYLEAYDKEAKMLINANVDPKEILKQLEDKYSIIMKDLEQRYPELRAKKENRYITTAHDALRKIDRLETALNTSVDIGTHQEPDNGELDENLAGLSPQMRQLLSESRQTQKDAELRRRLNNGELDENSAELKPQIRQLISELKQAKKDAELSFLQQQQVEDAKLQQYKNEANQSVNELKTLYTQVKNQINNNEPIDEKTIQDIEKATVKYQQTTSQMFHMLRFIKHPITTIPIPPFSGEKQEEILAKSLTTQQFKTASTATVTELTKDIRTLAGLPETSSHSKADYMQAAFKNQPGTQYLYEITDVMELTPDQEIALIHNVANKNSYETAQFTDATKAPGAEQLKKLGLTDSEILAIELYTGGLNGKMNNLMRSIGNGQANVAYNDPELAKLCSIAMRGIAKLARTNTPQKVSRRVEMAPLMNDNILKPGAIFSDAGFVSTTKGDAISNHSKFNGNLTYEMTTQQYVDIDSLSIHQGNMLDDELLVMPGTRFIIGNEVDYKPQSTSSQTSVRELLPRTLSVLLTEDMSQSSSQMSAPGSLTLKMVEQGLDTATEPAPTGLENSLAFITKAKVHNTKLKSKNTPTGRALELATAPASHIVDAFNKGKLPAPPSKLHPLLKEKLLVGLYPQEYFNKIQNQDISSLEGSKIKELDEQYAQTTKP